jgi:hypothetical protein
MSLGEIAYLCLVVGAATAFAVTLFALSVEDERRRRRLAGATVHRTPPQAGVTAPA